MSDEVIKQPDPLELIEIVPGYRETRSTKHLDKALQVFHQSIKNKGLKKSCEARVKTRTGGEFSYRYVAFSDLLNSIEESLLEAGLELKQPPIQAGNTDFGVLTILSHPESGEKIVSGPFLLNNEKGGITGAGAACTSASRYSVTRLLGIALDDDEDGRQSQGNSYTQGQGYSSRQKPAAGQQAQGKSTNGTIHSHSPGSSRTIPTPTRSKFWKPCAKRSRNTRPMWPASSGLLILPVWALNSTGTPMLPLGMK